MDLTQESVSVLIPISEGESCAATERYTNQALLNIALNLISTEKKTQVSFYLNGNKKMKVDRAFLQQ